jgi:hypothetical protein
MSREAGANVRARIPQEVEAQGRNDRSLEWWQHRRRQDRIPIRGESLEAGCGRQSDSDFGLICGAGGDNGMQGQAR